MTLEQVGIIAAVISGSIAAIMAWLAYVGVKHTEKMFYFEHQPIIETIKAPLDQSDKKGPMTLHVKNIGNGTTKNFCYKISTDKNQKNPKMKLKGNRTFFAPNSPSHNTLILLDGDFSFKIYMKYTDLMDKEKERYEEYEYDKENNQIGLKEDLSEQITEEIRNCK